MKEPAPFRDRLLGFLRSSARRLPLREQEEDWPEKVVQDISGWMQPSPTGSSMAERRIRFIEALNRVKGEVLDLVDAVDPRAVLLETVRSIRMACREATKPLAAMDRDPAWSDFASRESGRLRMAEILQEADFKVVEVPAASSKETMEILSTSALGVTLADGALSETGTAVQAVRSWRPRSISLLPPVHLVVIPENRILTGLGELFGNFREKLSDSPGYLTLITGPSRTADIEKVLTIGVHGPGRLVAALVKGC